MKGRWLEKGGVNFWTAFVNQKREEATKSAFGFEDDRRTGGRKLLSTPQSPPLFRALSRLWVSRRGGGVLKL
jgi:hypothetical protein